jgi:transposase
MYDIYRRWHDGQSITSIARSTAIDRKTVRKYVNRILKAGFTRQGTLVARESFFTAAGSILPTLRRSRHTRSLLEPHIEELRRLITDHDEPVKPKTAYLIISQKYQIPVSYETFKIFAREQRLCRELQKCIMRIETDPGIETQLDYGKVGILTEAVSGVRRIVWAFCGILAHSRLPFIQFVYTQKAISFCNSVIDMVEFYGGTTATLRMDNLKAAVIKPDLWDPAINRSLAEVAEHYGFFVDPCRITRATDKGKVERQVPVARELFRRLKHLHPSAELSDLNTHALTWCRQEYGMNRHGTTGMPPWQVFQDVEKQTLKKLPAERFQVGEWKPAKVHADRFVALNRKYYCVPEGYAGTTVWLRFTDKTLHIFDGERLLRTYVIGENLRSWLPQDFPEGRREMMDGSYPRFLLKEAQRYGEAAVRYLEFLLQPHAYLNARRARAVLTIMQQYATLPLFSSVCSTALTRHVRQPQAFKVLCEDERRQLHFQLPLELSETGRAMTRPIHYYISTQGGLDGDTTSPGTASETAANAGDAGYAGTPRR